LQKYKDLGTFDPDDSGFSIGKYEVDGEPCDHGYEQLTKTPAIFVSFYEGTSDWDSVPKSLSDVLECIIWSLQEEEISDEDLFVQLETELEEKSDEIMAAYKRVIWRYSENSNEGNHENYSGSIQHNEDYEFDPTEGEKFHHMRKAGWGSDEQVEEGTIFSEKTIINGEVIQDFKLEPEDWSEEAEHDDDEEDDE